MFWILRSFDLGDLGVLEKSWGNIFNDYIFEISLFHWSKCTIECAIYSILILNSAQARGDSPNQFLGLDFFDVSYSKPVLIDSYLSCFMKLPNIGYPFLIPKRMARRATTKLYYSTICLNWSIFCRHSMYTQCSVQITAYIVYVYIYVLCAFNE